METLAAAPPCDRAATGMDQDEKSQVPPPDAAPKASKPEDAFDVWLQRSLHELYDSVTSEPIPAELLRLIEEDRARRAK